MLSHLSNISVILVRTLEPGNIGSAARAMKNMGLHRLKLVELQKELNLECRKMAAGAYDLVESAMLYDNFDEAVADEKVLVATTSSRSRLTGRVLDGRKAAPEIAQLASRQRVGLVFGPERSGLSAAELARCQFIVSITADPRYPVLNLAQAVLLLGYELFGQSVEQEEVGAEPVSSDRQRQEMFQQAEKFLIDAGFLSASNPAPIVDSLRQMLRPDLAPRDLAILRGILSQADWYIREGHRLDPKKVRKE